MKEPATAEQGLVDRLTGPLGPTAGPALGRELLALWSEPHRRYHTVAHLRAVLDHLAELGAATYAVDPAAVELAAWFHDAVYDPRVPDAENVEASALLAERLLAEGPLPPARRAEVARLVRVTAGHDPDEGDTNAAALCDADLAVLAASPREYAAYAAEIRQEFGFVPDDAFRTGRAAVLRHLLSLPRLFRTPYGAAHWEETARYNLSGELRLLTT
ncbi:HD domain-containing protein [Streptomyces sp. 4N509B]|uniref:HD domain-containing protein n=1 Tax=Streptomyces sp. 4N509B TaxID=3457413 RepID=UPI003FD2B80F